MKKCNNLTQNPLPFPQLQKEKARLSLAMNPKNLHQEETTHSLGT